MLFTSPGINALPLYRTTSSRRAFYCLLIAGLLCISQVNANPFRLDDSGPEIQKSQEAYRLGAHLQYLLDPGEQWDIDTLYARRYSLLWQPTKDDGGTVGMVDAPLWFISHFSTDSDIDGMYYLDLGNNMPDKAIIYLFENGALKHQFALGNKMLIANRPIPSASFLVNFNLQANSRYELVIEMLNHSWVDLPMTLYTDRAFVKAEHDFTLTVGMMYGIFIATALYNMLLFFSSREKSYGLLVPTIISMALFFASLDQTGFTYLWPHWPELNEVMVTISAMLIILTNALFAQRFLLLKRRSRLAYNSLSLVIALSGATIIFNIFSPRSPFVLDAVTLIAITGFSLFMAIGTLSARAGNRSALYFLIAWLPISAVMVWLSFNLLGIVQTNIDPFWQLLRVATCAQVILLSLAVGSRLRTLAEKRAQAEEVSKAKSDVIARVSHEIRTPMNGILGLSHLLRDKLLHDSEAAHYNEMIHQSGTALLGVINDLLDLARIESNKMDLETIPLELDAITHQTQALFQHQLDEKQLTMDVRIAPEVPTTVSGDPTRLRQILLNLISNAIKFTHKGRITLSVYADEPGWITLQVADTGLGIPQEQQDLLFDAFTQASTDVVRKHGGSGLGLFICKRLAQHMGGELALSSEPNKGSTFTLRLPMPACAPIESNEELDLHLQYGFDILVAEDNEVNQLVVKKILARMGHNVSLAENGEKAVAYYSKHHRDLDLVLMDCEMPYLNGYEATEAIRQFEADNDLPRKPIVAITAHALSDHREICLACGMDDELHKPLQIEELKKILVSLPKKDTTEDSTL